jgi:uncharacterized protein YfaP (DUF2135 family)
MRRLLCALVFLSVPSTSAAQERPLSVRIEAPHAGVVEGPVVRLTARVSDPSLRHATLVVNGAAYDVPVEQGRIAQQIVAVPGNNRVAVLAERHGSQARDSLTFHYDGPAMELIVLLTWPSEGEIVDLWVREPGGETCKWDHRSTQSGGSLLDFSADAIGFGSQAYVAEQLRAGTYRLKIHYWGAAAEEDQRSSYTYDELITSLDDVEQRMRAAAVNDRSALEQRAAQLRARLDRWSSPAAPQTAVRAEAILFPGTPHERRWRFDRIVHRTGELVTLGEVEISDVMIRAAREGRR